jgi:hypothetical protein
MEIKLKMYNVWLFTSKLGAPAVNVNAMWSEGDRRFCFPLFAGVSGGYKLESSCEPKVHIFGVLFQIFRVFFICRILPF